MDAQRIVPIHHSKLIKVFELDGFAISRKKRDHIIMTKPGVNRPLVIKTSPKLVPITHIRTNMKTAGMSRRRYFEFLGQVR